MDGVGQNRTLKYISGLADLKRLRIVCLERTEAILPTSQNLLGRNHEIYVEG
jgi:hypothetical protein